MAERPAAHGLTQAQIAALYERTGALVLRRCRLILRDASEAEDVMQEVFIRVMRYGGGADAPNVPLSYLYRAAERCCFDRMTKRRREGVGARDDVAERPPLVAFPPSSRNLEAANLVEHFFSRLDSQLQQLAILHYVDGLTQEAIAEALGLSRRTIGKKLKLLHKRADKLAHRYGGGA